MYIVKKKIRTTLLITLKMVNVFISVWLGYFLEKLC